MSSSNLMTGVMLVEEIQTSLEAAVKTAAEPLVKALLEDVEKQVRKELGAIACSLLREYDIQRRTDQLEIRVRLTDDR